VFRNGIDPLQYLISNREHVAKSIGVEPKYIYDSRRNLGIVQQLISKMEGSYEIGDKGRSMQMYISKCDGNVSNLDSQMDWTDYIMTQDWIDALAECSIVSGSNSVQGINILDHRLSYLSDMIHGMMKDHEIDYHKDIQSFDGYNYLDKVKFASLGDGGYDVLEPIDDGENRFTDAFNKLNSFGKLDYGFYEMYKPIGGS
jgi:hypothetical protein